MNTPESPEDEHIDAPLLSRHGIEAFWYRWLEGAEDDPRKQSTADFVRDLIDALRAAPALGSEDKPCSACGGVGQFPPDDPSADRCERCAVPGSSTASTGREPLAGFIDASSPGDRPAEPDLSKVRAWLRMMHERAATVRWRDEVHWLARELDVDVEWMPEPVAIADHRASIIHRLEERAATWDGEAASAKHEDDRKVWLHRAAECRAVAEEIRLGLAASPGERPRTVEIDEHAAFAQAVAKVLPEHSATLKAMGAELLWRRVNSMLDWNGGKTPEPPSPGERVSGGPPDMPSESGWYWARWCEPGREPGPWTCCHTAESNAGDVDLEWGPRIPDYNGAAAPAVLPPLRDEPRAVTMPEGFEPTSHEEAKATAKYVLTHVGRLNSTHSTVILACAYLDLAASPSPGPTGERDEVRRLRAALGELRMRIFGSDETIGSPRANWVRFIDAVLSGDWIGGGA